jgi:hypothetical protein
MRLKQALVLSLGAVLVGFYAAAGFAADAKPKPPTRLEIVEDIIAHTQPLKFPRGNRLPLYLWSVNDIPTDDPAKTEEILKKLDERGIGVCMSWTFGGAKDKALAAALTVAKIQKKLGIPIGSNATGAVYSVFDGTPATAHVGQDGKPFFDKSVVAWFPSGSPFAVEQRVAPVKAQVDYFAKGFADAGLAPDLIVADWEWDLPIEVNGAWEANKKSKLSEGKFKDINNFNEFQATVRTIRADLQKRIFTDTVKGYFPKVLVGNYGVYPNDGFRYWYDFFEKEVDTFPAKVDGHAKYRQWFQEFPLTGYTYAMPVVYPRYPMYSWYDFDNADFRWFRPMLLNASNGPAHVGAGTPVVAFVKYFTCDGPAKPDSAVKQLSEEMYKEFLWHMLLRKTTSFYNWCPDTEATKEAELLQGVYADSLEYEEYFEKGTPISFETPTAPGPVVSGLKLGNKVLVLRTDFTDTKDPVEVKIGSAVLSIPRVDGKCQVLTIK